MRIETNLRVARSTDRLEAVVRFYTEGLGLSRLDAFENHAGFDGVMVGVPGATYHLEFTRKRGHEAGPAPTEDNLLVFYLPNASEWRNAVDRMIAAGYLPVAAFNPYWDRAGRTFEDPDGYRAVLQNAAWPPTVENSKRQSMAKLVFAMNMSLDGYVNHEAIAPPEVALFHHFIERVGNLTGSIYGRGLYEVMRYWDEDQPEWDASDRAFAEAWRRQPKWVVSHSLKSVGPNATLLGDDFPAAIRRLKAELQGQIDVGGPKLVASLTKLGLIDEYQIYLRPAVLGHGNPYFAGPYPPLRLVAGDRLGEDTMMLTYVPA